jgi:hypothetical protein
MISYRRGHVHIVDIERVRNNACECHKALESHYRKIFGAGLTVQGIVAQRTADTVFAR